MKIVSLVVFFLNIKVCIIEIDVEQKYMDT